MPIVKEESLYNTTNDKIIYINSWNYHIDELVSIGIPLSNVKLYNELKEIQTRLKELIKIAANEQFS